MKVILVSLFGFFQSFAEPESCRSGYEELGDRCYKLLWEDLGWHEAAIKCGADGGGLARFDTQADDVLGEFLWMYDVEEAWIGGNSHVISARTNLDWRSRDFQVESPRRSDYVDYSVNGCFHAYFSGNSWGVQPLRDCERKMPAVCGYSINLSSRYADNLTTRQTTYYNLNDRSSAADIKRDLIRSNYMYLPMLCDNPIEAFCKVEPVGYSGVRDHRLKGYMPLVTQNTQISDTLTCETDNITCKKGRELKCDTVQVRFTCPNEWNMCDIFRVTRSATPCEDGKKCVPVREHYVCQ